MPPAPTAATVDTAMAAMVRFFTRILSGCELDAGRSGRCRAQGGRERELEGLVFAGVGRVGDHVPGNGVDARRMCTYGHPGTARLGEAGRAGSGVGVDGTRGAHAPGGRRA